MVRNGAAAIGPLCAKAESNRPIGIIEPRMVTPMMPIGISRSVSARLLWPPAVRARLAASADGHALDDRADDLEQGPDRGDADRAGADEAHLLAKHGADQRVEIGRRRDSGKPGLPRHEHEPADDQPGQHRDPDRHADQMADPDQRHRQAGRDGGRAGAEAESCAPLRWRQIWSGRATRKRRRRSSSRRSSAGRCDFPPHRRPRRRP